MLFVRLGSYSYGEWLDDDFRSISRRNFARNDGARQIINGLVIFIFYGSTKNTIIVVRPRSSYSEKGRM